MDKVTYDDFARLEFKVGKILEASRVEKSEKLLKLSVDFGDETRQVISGIAKSYSPESLIGNEFVFITNLEPRNIMGLESQAMIMATGNEDKIVALVPQEEVEPGSLIR